MLPLFEVYDARTDGFVHLCPDDRSRVLSEIPMYLPYESREEAERVLGEDMKYRRELGKDVMNERKQMSALTGILDQPDT